MDVGIAIDSSGPKRPYGAWLFVAGLIFVEIAWLIGIFCFVLWRMHRI